MQWGEVCLDLLKANLSLLASLTVYERGQDREKKHLE